MRTGRSQSNMPGLRLVGKEESGLVSTPFGPARVGSTTTQITQSHQLTALLNSLEREVKTLESRYSEVLDTLTSATKRLVELTDSLLKEDTIKEDESK